MRPKKGKIKKKESKVNTRFFFLIILLLLMSYTYSMPIIFNLGAYTHCCTPRENKIKMVNKIYLPVSNAFEMGLSADMFDTGKGYAGRGANSLSVKTNLFLPLNVISQFKYEVLRDGKEINNISGNVQVGDTIRIIPNLASLKQHGDDFIFQGATYDSPPIKMLTPDQYTKVATDIYDKFISRYPCASYKMPFRAHPNSCPYEFPGAEIPEFKKETVPFDEKDPYYISDNGYPVYIVPFDAKRKAGIQVFCSYVPMLGFPMSCLQDEKGILTCKVKRAGKISMQTRANIACTYFIDKIIKDGEAIKAEWANVGIPANLNASGFITLQAVPPGKEPPIAKLECNQKIENREIYGENYKILVIECDASASYDPDGKITKYEYEIDGHPIIGKGPYFQSPYVVGPYLKVPYHITQDQNPTQLLKSGHSVMLKVIDNDSYFGRTMVSTNPSAPQITLTAEYNKQTRMAEVTAKCETEKINISINNAVTGSSVLEKQPIKCGQTTPIGPIKVKGAYKVSAASNPEITPAVFTVD